jgi:CcmD family protein
VVTTALAVTLSTTVWASVPLVGLDEAVDAAGPVQVAGVVDRASVRSTDDRSTFAVTGPGDIRLDVSFAGKLPEGFDVAPVVVLVGSSGVEGRFEAAEVLVPTAGPPEAGNEPAGPARGLQAVAAVTMVVWIGLFVYLLGLHRKLRTLEAA